MKRYAITAYKGAWPYKDTVVGLTDTDPKKIVYGDAWRSEHDDLADALALFGAHARAARELGGSVAVSVDGFEVLAYQDGKIYVATDIAIVPGPHAFEAPKVQNGSIWFCKYCQLPTDTNTPEWWMPNQVCPKQPTQETWRTKVLVG